MTHRRKIILAGALPLMLVAVLTGADIILEPRPLLWSEIGIDLADRLILLTAMAVVIWIVLQMLRIDNEQVALGASLRDAIASGRDWRARSRVHIEGLGRAIEDQFVDWGLTTAERDIAGLILKGMSLKDIAAARHTSEATIRQQAQRIYRKSGLSGRTELAAYFLESLFDAAENGAAKVLHFDPVARPQA